MAMNNINFSFCETKLIKELEIKKKIKKFGSIQSLAFVRSKPMTFEHLLLYHTSKEEKEEEKIICLYNYDDF